MRLYATTTSERATKGQGGNKQLDIDILICDRNTPRYHISINPDKLIFTERGYSEPLLIRYHKDIWEQETKGKRQKGEKKCLYFTDCGNYTPQNDAEAMLCDECYKAHN